jgi:hypothetical protein
MSPQVHLTNALTLIRAGYANDSKGRPCGLRAGLKNLNKRISGVSA